MTQTLPTVAAAPAAPAPRDPQRETLEQIVKLSMECTAREQQLEHEHAEAQAKEDAGFRKRTEGAREEQTQELGALKESMSQRKEALIGDLDGRLATLESESEESLRRLTKKKSETDHAIKKTAEQNAWQAESGLVNFGMKLDAEELKADKDLQALLASLTALQTQAHEALIHERINPPTVDVPNDEALRQKIAEEPLPLVKEHQEKATALLEELRTALRAGFGSGALPIFLIIVLAAGGGAAGWFLTPDAATKPLAAGGATLGVIVLGSLIFVLVRMAKRRSATARAMDLYTSLAQSVSIASKAARSDVETAAVARELKNRDAQRKRDVDVKGARDKGRAQLAEAAEQHRRTLEEQTAQVKAQREALQREREQALGALTQARETAMQELETRFATGRQEDQRQHEQAAAAIEAEYASGMAALKARWDEGLRAVGVLLAAGAGIDPALIDWQSAAWEQWKAPTTYTNQVRFGEMKVDLALLTEHVPRGLELPGPFQVPALLTYPHHGSLLVDVDHAARPAGIELAQMVMARLLTQMPAGRVKFTLFDPVGLGQSFAGFMHLADHDESLVGSRIWTEKEQIDQRLTDLTEHMETVIQKYLRNEYASIEQYNAQAGELAEPFRFLVVADFPTGFEAESLRRLSSIALTGPRCGVYTIILRDTRLPMPPGARMEDLLSRSVHLLHKNGQFQWEDAVFKRFPLKVDPAPDEKTLTRLMDQVGVAAKDAKRVEVPFRSIAPPLDKFWSLSSQYDLRVPIGKSGATRLQPLRLGVGVAQHVLVAGKTGSGKSNLMHTIVTNMAMWYGPDEVEFYLVDFKKGVEFKAYATSELPHARAIAVESDREFGLSVLQRVDAELTRRGVLFRDAGAQELGAYREKTGQKLPRTILLIDEFQEFFSEDDKLAQEASGLLDRLVRQGRAFGVHVVLGSQTIGGSSGLSRSTLGQIAVRVALQCTEADSQLILGDNNSAARLLTRPGEAIYNDAGGLVEANSPFQIAFLPDAEREEFLEKVHDLAQQRHSDAPQAIVFEGNSPAVIRKNERLIEMIESPGGTHSAPVGYIGEPVAIKTPSAIPFRRQGGANVLMVGQQEESAIAIFASIAASIAAQQPAADAIFYLIDGTPSDSRYFGMLERVLAAFPHKSNIVSWRTVPESINELHQLLVQRQADDSQAGPDVYILLFGLQRFRQLRKQEDDFSFSRGGEEAPKPDKQLAELLSEGPSLGIHAMLWADAPITLERTLDRGSMRQFDHRILFQMSAADSSNLIDSPLANRLGTHRALLYSEEQGTTEKFRPYQLPDEGWLGYLSEHLKAKK